MPALALDRDALRLLDAIPAMAWRLLPDGRVDFLNRHWLKYTGLSMSEALARPTGVIHPGDVAKAVAHWRRSLESGEAYELEMRLRGADGTYRWFLVRTEPLRDEQGAIVKWYGTCSDLGEAREVTADPLSTLSPRELLVLKLVAEGLSSRDVAKRLGLTRGTVDTYRSRIMEKLGIHNVAGVVRFAIRHGLLQP